MNFRDAPVAAMPDVQGSHDTRNLPIQRVGIRDLRYPMQFAGRDGVHPTVAQMAFSVALPGDQKGTHMSRFHALLEARTEPLSLAGLPAWFSDMLARLEADSGRIELRMPFFMRKTAPVSGVQSLMDYELTLVVDGAADAPRVTLAVHVPVTSLCPCSKSISAYGAHNQRSMIVVEVQGAMLPQPEAVVETIEAQASSQLYGLLKRADEKFVTERAYENPRFVEDLVREVALAIGALTGVEHYAVEAENFESIHNHSAFARLTSPRYALN